MFSLACVIYGTLENNFVIFSNLQSKTDDFGLYTCPERAGVIEFREDIDVIEQVIAMFVFRAKLLIVVIKNSIYNY